MAGNAPDRLALLIVWIDMLEKDSDQAAARAARLLDREARGAHFHDPQRAVGASVASALGGRGEVAWDVYLFFPPGRQWGGAPPEPDEWYHQLGGSAWAGKSHHRIGRGLAGALSQGAARFAARSEPRQ